MQGQPSALGVRTRRKSPSMRLQRVQARSAALYLEALAGHEMMVRSSASLVSAYAVEQSTHVGTSALWRAFGRRLGISSYHRKTRSV